MTGPVLLLDALSWRFPNAPAPLFEGLSAPIPAGLTLVCGDEGCGKSTLLRLMAGQLAPQGGRILAGTPAAALGPATLRAQVVWHDEHEARFDQDIVSELLGQWVSPSDRPHLAELTRGLGLEPHLHKPLYQLSRGSRRKVFIAASLARSEALLTLLDQPFSALDKPSISFLCEQLALRARRDDRALVMADYTAPEGVPLAATLELG